MTRPKKTVVVVIVVVVATGVVWQRREVKKCRERQATYDSRVEHIRKAAEIGLRPGTTREAAAAFMNAQELGFAYNPDNKAATGAIYMKACSPGWYCGDDALIYVVVQFDDQGRVKSKNISGGYTNCL